MLCPRDAVGPRPQLTAVQYLPRTVQGLPATGLKAPTILVDVWPEDERGMVELAHQPTTAVLDADKRGRAHRARDALDL